MDAAQITSQYFAEYVRKGFRATFTKQRAIAAENIYNHDAKTLKGYPRSRSHVLEHNLQSPDYTINPSGYGIFARVNYPSYIRFLDMRRLGNYRIYNRPIWGILYKQTLKDIRYEFCDWLREWYAEEIRQCMQKINQL